MRALTSAGPIMTVILVTLVAALPWGMASQYRFVLPFLVCLTLHFWVLRHPGDVPEWLPFASGLLLDVLTGGPLGYWAFVFLTGYVVALQQSVWSQGGKTSRWLLLTSALVLVAAFAWALSSLYYFEWAELGPFANGAAYASLLYPVMAFLLSMFAMGSWVSPRSDDNLNLRRGG